VTPVRLSRVVPILLVTIGLTGWAATAWAQSTPGQVAPSGPLKLFLDCQYQCDFDFIRKELLFVDHVRDSQSADVHALVTTESTGAGGTRWTVQFLGLGRFAGHDEALVFTTPETATSDDRRRELLKWLKLGLATHAVMATGRADVDIVSTSTGATASAAKAADPWNAWVFSINVNGYMNGEASSKSANHRFGASANRVTDNWKLSINSNWNRNTSTFEVSDTETVKSLTTGWNTNSLVVKSVSAHWSVAGRGAFSGSTFSNYDFSARGMGGIEYDVFPYSESTRRSLTFSYMAGLAHFDFTDLTIFETLTATNPEHSIVAALGLRQPWGSVGMQATLAQQLDEPSRNRFTIYGDAEVRLFKGFSFNVFGDYSRIRDQINLRKEDASEEEVLLRQRQLATGYSYFVAFGVSYRFGSIYDNVVNPRFRNF
jgi:hypothetical protein